MKSIINKISVPVLICALVNVIGLVYHTNYSGAVAGSIVGLLVALFAIEIKAKVD